jgi:hypothetical protein
MPSQRVRMLRAELRAASSLTMAASASELAQDAQGRGRLGERLSAYVAGDGCTILSERNLVHILVHS